MAGKKYSDLFVTSNTANVADTDLFALERADGNTYVLRANSIYNYVSNKVLSTRAVNYINTATFTANSSSDVIICNPEEAAATIAVTLPAGSNTSNKQYTIKCTNTAGLYQVTVTTSNTSQTSIESSTGGTVGTTTSLTVNGQFCTWISFGGVYRKIS